MAKPCNAIVLAEMPQRMSLTLSDGYETSVFIHRPTLNKEIAGAVLYLHGIQSHPGWYYESARRLADSGFIVYQVTRRGCGDNDIARGDAKNQEILLQDVSTAIDFIARDSGIGNVHLIGVSWGGKLLTAYAIWSRRRRNILSMTLLTPGVSAKVGPSLSIKIKIALSMLIGPLKYYPIPLSDCRLFTNTPSKQEYIDQDDHSLRAATARFFFASRALDKMISNASSGDIKIPTNLILATNDRIINTESCETVYRRIVGDNLAVEILDGSHSLEFEPDNEPLFAKLTGFLAEQS